MNNKQQVGAELDPTRRQFLVSSAAVGGGLAIGIQLPFGATEAAAQSAADAAEVGIWVAIRPDDTCVIRIVRSEMGQGTRTGLAQLVAEELPKARSTLGEAAWQAGKYAEGAALFEQITLGDYVEFLTLPAYEKIQ